MPVPDGVGVAVGVVLIVEVALDPGIANFVTKAFEAPPKTIWKAPAVTGKLAESVDPVTYASPELFTATATPRSKVLPPKKVEYTSPEPSGVNFVTNASWPPQGWAERSRR